MAGRKDFTKADGAIDRLFTMKHDNVTNDSNVTNKTNDSNNTKDLNVSNNTNDTKHTHDTNIMHGSNIKKYSNITKHTNDYNNTKPTNKSKHYDTRGKRGVRFGMLLDGRLKEDLMFLSKATGSRSVNDFIVTVLLEYVEREDNQERLELYRRLL